METNNAGGDAGKDYWVTNTFGYTCQRCGQWIPNGTAHVCPWYQGSSFITFDAEATTLLREIRDLLKQLVEKSSVTTVVNNSSERLTVEQLSQIIDYLKSEFEKWQRDDR